MSELSSNLKFKGVISERREPIIARRAEEDRQRQIEHKIRARESKARKLAEAASRDLDNLLRTGGIVSFFHEAQISFGTIESDSAGLAHDAMGGPKQIGASISDIGNRVYSWSEEQEEIGWTSRVRYASKGISLDYLKRMPSFGGYKYQLFRYALMLAKGEDVGDETAVWHGELTPIVIDAVSGRSKNFWRLIRDSKRKQDRELSGESTFRPKGNTPLPPFVEFAEPMPQDPKEIIRFLDEGLTLFAEKYYQPIEEQVRSRRVLVPSLFFAKK